MTSDAADKLSTFGPNEWLVDEIYQQFLTDRKSVDPAWWDFFTDYVPGDATMVAKAVAPVAAPLPQAAAATPVAAPVAAPTLAPAEATTTVMRGTSARLVENMEASLGVPTATSVRAVPAKLLADNRNVINRHLARGRGGKVSFTHIIGYAIVKAIAAQPAMNNSFAEIDGKPTVITPAHVNFGLAIDLQKPDGSRTLMVPSIKAAETMDFAMFHATYEDLVRRARNNKLGVDDFVGTTISLTNPGTIGTVHSVPRLMQGQGCIIGAGALEYPAEWQGASSESIVRNAVSKILTLTSTYDHRIIQGAQSGDFLARVHALLLGEDGFYDDIFKSLRMRRTSTRTSVCRKLSTPIAYAVISWPIPIHSNTSSVRIQISTS